MPGLNLISLSCCFFTTCFFLAAWKRNFPKSSALQTGGDVFGTTSTRSSPIDLQCDSALSVGYFSPMSVPFSSINFTCGTLICSFTRFLFFSIIYISLTVYMVGASGIEPPTTTMSRWCSTAELRACLKIQFNLKLAHGQYLS